MHQQVLAGGFIVAAAKSMLSCARIRPVVRLS